MHVEVSPIRQPRGFSVERLPGPFGLKKGYPVIFNIPMNTELKTVTTVVAARLTLWISDQVRICLFLTRLERANAVGFISNEKDLRCSQACGSHLGNQCGEKCSNSSFVPKRHDPPQTKRQNIAKLLTNGGLLGKCEGTRAS